MDTQMVNKLSAINFVIYSKYIYLTPNPNEEK
jgi:hypothetical protein